LKERFVRFTATAQRHIKREKTWWFENRADTDAFATEVEDALRILALFPGIGTLYTAAGVSGLRRLYLRKIDCHLYYTFDEREVIVRALWGARRRRGPRIKA
jgi:plasmid stabilization system protein ParE